MSGISNQSSIGQDAAWIAGNFDEAVEWVPGGGEAAADWLRSQGQGPVPGEPATLRETAGHLSTLGKACERAGEGFRAIDDGGWYGKAADGFHAYLDQAAPKWFRAADALTEAGKAVTDYAETLESAQRRANRAQQELESAEQRTEQARQRHNAEVENYNAQVRRANGGGPAPDMARPGEFVDPAADDKRAAKETIEQAKAEVNAAGDRAAGILRRACAEAPEEPGMLARWRDNVVDGFQAHVDMLQDFGSGLVSGAAEMVKGVRMVSPVDPYNVTHPASYGENLFTMGKGVVGAVTHPYQAVKTTINVEGWQNNPAQALGKAVPSALASLAGGSGSAAKLSSMAGKFGRFGDELAGLGKRASDLSSLKRAKPEEPDVGSSSSQKDGSSGSRQRPSQPSHPGQHQPNQPSQPSQPSNQGQQPGGHGQSAGNPPPPQQPPAQPNTPPPEVSSSTPPWANQDLPPSQPPRPEPPSPGSGGFGDPAGQQAGTRPFGPGSAPQQDFGPGPRPDGGFGPGPRPDGGFGPRGSDFVPEDTTGDPRGGPGDDHRSPAPEGRGNPSDGTSDSDGAGRRSGERPGEEAGREFEEARRYVSEHGDPIQHGDTERDFASRSDELPDGVTSDARLPDADHDESFRYRDKDSADNPLYRRIPAKNLEELFRDGLTARHPDAEVTPESLEAHVGGSGTPSPYISTTDSLGHAISRGFNDGDVIVDIRSPDPAIDTDATVHNLHGDSYSMSHGEGEKLFVRNIPTEHIRGAWKMVDGEPRWFDNPNFDASVMKGSGG